MTLGFVSGRMDDSFVPRLKFFRSLGCNALEVHPSQEELATKKFSKAEIAAIKEFEYVSLHYVQKDARFELSTQTNNWIKSLPISLVVIHPHLDLDVVALSKQSWPIALENMDVNKKTAKTVDQMQEWLNRFPDANMVLDINHCFTNDNSLRLVQDMYQNFSDKIRELHFSGYINREQIHEPITTSGCEHLLKTIPNKHLPIILEVNVSNLNEEVLSREYETVKNYLSS